jgi:hypothetical protein
MEREEKIMSLEITIGEIPDIPDIPDSIMKPVVSQCDRLAYRSAEIVGSLVWVKFDGGVGRMTVGRGELENSNSRPRSWLSNIDVAVHGSEVATVQTKALQAARLRLGTEGLLD